MTHRTTRYIIIPSLEAFPRAERLYMVMKLGKGEMEVYKNGREATDVEMNTALWQYHQALNEAEAQIEKLLAIVRLKSDFLDDDSEAYQAAIETAFDYKDEYQEEGDELERYAIDEKKAALHEAMARKDEKAIARLANEMNLALQKATQTSN